MKRQKAAIRATPGPDFAQRVLTLAYRRLGRRYPAVFMAIELQTAWFITAGLLGLLSLYYEAPNSDLLLVLAISLALTGVTIAVALYRSLRYLRPLAEWIDSDRSDPEFAERAWSTAIGMPLYLLRRQMRLPIFGVAIPGSIAGVAILGLPALAFLPILAASLIAIGYSGILHYFAVEAGLRPVVVDINRVVPPRLSTGHKAISLRLRLMVALPMINVITGLVALALSGDHGGGGSRRAGPRHRGGDGSCADDRARALDALVARSIIRPIGDLQKGIEAVQRGRLRRHGPGHDRRRAGRALGRLQPDGHRAGRARADPRGVRHLPRRGGRRVHPQRGLLAGGLRGRGLAAVLRRARLHRLRGRRRRHRRSSRALNELFEAVVPIIAEHGGHVDKFIGDGLLAVFGAPRAPTTTPTERCAPRCEIARRVNYGDSVLLRVGVGVNSGTVIAGSIGGAGRLNFSVIGDAVNVAARVEAATRRTGDDVLITASTRELLGKRWSSRSAARGSSVEGQGRADGAVRPGRPRAVGRNPVHRHADRLKTRSFPPKQEAGCVTTCTPGGAPG